MPLNPYTQRQEILQRIVDLCVRLGMQEFVIAPGSRSAPITAAVAARPELQTYVIMDERSAGYVALGMAQQRGKPVGLICTSGTAALNFAPAVTEAFYQRVPLLIFTADRPPEWIDQQDNQAIHQFGLYNPHVRGSYELPVDYAHPDTHWQVERLLAQAIQATLFPTPGPIHINVPLREPIYPSQPVTAQALPATKLIQVAESRTGLTEQSWLKLAKQWQTSQRKLVIGGMHRPDKRLSAALRQLGQDPSVAVIGDITANLFPQATQLFHADMALGARDETIRSALAPDLVVTFGGQIVSKYLRQLLRSKPPRHLWHIQPGGDFAPDTFQGLTDVLPIEPVDFFSELHQHLPALTEPAELPYAQLWQQLEANASQQLATFLTTAPFGEFKAMYEVMKALPNESYLQLGNSMPIRYANFITCPPYSSPRTIHCFSNRGTSGIDGTLSTAVGAALVNPAITTLIVGDLAFFYDRNGLWHRHVPANLRIVLLNNHGGGIFDIIEGPGKLDRSLQERFFLTPQPLSARRTAEDHGLDYYFVNDGAMLTEALAHFFAPSERAAILEIESDMTVNTTIFNQFRTLVAGLQVT